MPRKPRIELAGKYHIINRGVAQMRIFREPSDYEYFEELMCFYAVNIYQKVLALKISVKNKSDILKKGLTTDQENLLNGRLLMKFFMKKK